MKSFFSVARKWIGEPQSNITDVVFTVIVASSDATLNIEYVR